MGLERNEDQGGLVRWHIADGAVSVAGRLPTPRRQRRARRPRTRTASPRPASVTRTLTRTTRTKTDRPDSLAVLAIDGGRGAGRRLARRSSARDLQAVLA